MRRSLLALVLLTAALPGAVCAANSADHVPAHGPRTMVLSGQREAFRAYCTTGAGAEAFARIKHDLDTVYMAFPHPAEPLTYGDPEPSKRDTYKTDRWRGVQDLAGNISGIAEAATFAWLVTGEDRYLAKAKEFLLTSTDWHFAPDWESGEVLGATDVYYNDEGNFRLWRKLPLIYDQLRDELTDAERARVLAHFKIRGERTVRWIRESNVQGLKRNSLEVKPSSHPVRFMAMVGLTALALWDDLPDEARAWWEFAYSFYRDQFSPFAGDAGGWAEGSAYWRGTFEHAGFQDALLAIGDPSAYASPFWRNTGYFAVYNVQPYLHTTFGDASNAGHFNLEPVMADYLTHLGRVQGNGYFLSYAALCDDPRESPSLMGMGKLARTYPTAGEFLIRNFIGSAFPEPAPAPLSELPPYRFFDDVGWVSMHSALGDPANDIHITFKSSPYGSYSHSHPDQNSFILNAYGEGLAINSANREFHRSPHHKGWTWQTMSKNAVLIDGQGQAQQDKHATGKITRFETGDRYVWTTGDALVAYQTMQPEGQLKRVTRDLLFIDQRYVVVRDRVDTGKPSHLAWLLHGEMGMAWHNQRQQAIIDGEAASLTAAIVSPDVDWFATITDEYPVPIDPRYRSKETYAWVTAEWRDHLNLTLESREAATTYTVFAVLWPEPELGGATALTARVDQQGRMVVDRPDGRTDTITLTDTTVSVK
ncbi:heparinase II/III domain-containing protein [Synoicihabitans lomoniglobus]|uniref:Heparinase II/III family protein n=1 Tax=Synoicihabitans lomoniglobus TaxID=2909285 RepID=A0AAF0I5C2_9BACT|nr:heparinase II/III family protein [Opitutaceae bacterium LMO-M01]WED67214.1 heparinase II/III family protein [Opitutaceae bacterium LMO-M01]